MTLPDTCVWVEVLADTPTGQRYRKLFDKPAELVVPTLVQYELRRWALRELGEDAADRVIAATRNARVVALDETTALHAAALAQQFQLAGADALIYASALRHQAMLVTCDAHFAGVAGVDFQPKAAQAARGRR
ncbi:MAG: type II toxin-antitoxin system VapC family toxin [Giesbergeria sp.]